MALETLGTVAKRWVAAIMLVGFVGVIRALNVVLIEVLHVGDCYQYRYGHAKDTRLVLLGELERAVAE